MASSRSAKAGGNGPETHRRDAEPAAFSPYCHKAMCTSVCPLVHHGLRITQHESRRAYASAPPTSYFLLPPSTTSTSSSVSPYNRYTTRSINRSVAAIRRTSCR